MELTDKRRFIEELIGNVQRDVLSKVDRVPEDWDGIELRQWIADHFTSAVYSPSSPARMKAYRNEVLVRNL
jgi:hypothetical protein